MGTWWHRTASTNSHTWANKYLKLEGSHARCLNRTEKGKMNAVFVSCVKKCESFVP